MTGCEHALKDGSVGTSNRAMLYFFIEGVARRMKDSLIRREDLEYVVMYVSLGYRQRMRLCALNSDSILTNH